MYSSLVKKILLLSIFTLPFSLFAQDSGGIEEVVVTAEKGTKFARCTIINNSCI